MKLHKLRILIAAFMLSLAALPFFAKTNTYAASARNFSPGNIISDATMANYGSMSVASIQSFLKSKNSCNDTNISKAARYTSYSYHIENGHFVCLADETFNGKSAAQIIYNAAQTYHINPQVIIVLLQKEQGLITDTWPNSRQYRTATGYGCPDTAACDSKYYGFENQVNNAAALFRSVLNGGWSNYAVGSRYIQYSPNKSCGGSTVYIQNRATSALYRYTPYQPNAAALNVGYGLGNSCSSYGNRNFYLYFADWFGNPTSGTSTVVPYTPTSNSTSTSTSTPIKSTPVINTFNKNTLARVYVPDGDYQITTVSGKALDIANASTASGANLQIYTRGASNTAQIFTLTRDSEGFYTIKNPKSRKVLDVANASTASGANVQIWDSNNTCAQKWAISIVNNHYAFRSACSGNALDVANGATSTNGVNVWSYAYNGSAAQQFDLIGRTAAPVANGDYAVVTNRGKNLDVASNSNVQILNRNDSVSQKFTFARLADGFYRITQTSTGKVLATDNTTATAGTNVKVDSSTNTCASKWAIIPTTNTAYKTSHFVLRSACSGAALDVTNANTATSGANVQVYNINNSNAQAWTFADPDYTYLTSGTYNVINNSVNRSLDFTNSKATLGAKLEIRNASKIPSQEFRFTRTSDGYYQITNVGSGKILSLTSTAVAISLTPTLQNQHSSCSSKWYFTKNGTRLIINSACSGYALTTVKLNHGSAVSTNYNRLSLNQSWVFTKR